jgi:elongation factor 1-gamma
LDVISTEPGFKFGETNKSADFLAKFPLGKVPAFEGSDGTCLFESNAIAYYVASEQLRGVDAKSAAMIQQWINFADNEILPSACKWVFPTLGITQFNKQETDFAKDHLKKCLTVLNVYLTSRTYLVGERVTLADVVLACNLLMVYKQVMEPSFRQPFANVTRWFETIVNHPEFISIAKQTKLCEKAAQPDHKKFAELHGGQQRDGQRRDSAKHAKKNQPQQQQAKKEKPADKGDDEPKPPADIDPLADAPKGTFDFDAFKRCFSNEDTLTKAIPHLWQNFDAEHYSIYHAVYKYKDELKMIFMSSNLARGLTQRVDKLRKYAFAVIYVLGVDNDNNIEAIWIFRGQRPAFELKEDWNVDAPSYDFHKLDPSKESDRQKVESFLLGQTVGPHSFPDENDPKQAAYICFK